MKDLYILKLKNNKGKICKNGIFYFESEKDAIEKSNKLLLMFPQLHIIMETAQLKCHNIY